MSRETEPLKENSDVAFADGPWKLRWRRFCRKRAAVVSLVFVICLIIVAVLAPWVAPHHYRTIFRGDRLSPPSSEYPLGTDNLGRCIFSRLVYGSRISLSVGLVAVGIALVSGVFLGLIAGYFGGVVDNIISRFIDVMLAFPAILLALVIIAILGPNLFNLMIAVGIASIPSYTRLVRGATLSAREETYVEASRAVGAKSMKIIFRHILPNISAPIIVMATLGVAGAILAAASLSFIGLGAPPPTPEWGAMLSGSRNFITRAWWMVTFPGLAITLTVLCINMVGDALRDILDPRLQGKTR